LTLAKDPPEGFRLPPYTPQEHGFGQNDPPGDHGKNQQNEKNGLSYRRCFLEQKLENVGLAQFDILVKIVNPFVIERSTAIAV
jgi:hypothetical protein